MKSGFSHLRKKIENQEQENFFGTIAAFDAVIEPDAETVVPVTSDCELDKPRWSVIAFDKVEADGLNYKMAAELMSNLDANGIPGLCITTDEAAARTAR